MSGGGGGDTGRAPVLQDDQKFALMKFRRSVADILKPDHDDFFLLRWLRARQWNANAAEKMLRDSIKWRERWGVDNIKNWKPPDRLMEFLPFGQNSFDKGGSPFVVVPFVGFDIWGVLHSYARADVIRAIIKLLEKNIATGFEQGKKYGPGARQVTVFFDMDGFNLKPYLWRPANEMVIALVKMYEANYPEMLKCCYIVNAPKIFAIGYNIIKKFLDEYTLSKIQIHKSDRRKWLPALFEVIDENQVPTCYGGTMVDTAGDPKCGLDIIWGGRVPKELYIQKEDSFNKSDNYNETLLKKGTKLKLAFATTEPGSILRWEFRTVDHDIKFGVRRVEDQSGTITDEIPLKRVASHQLDEIGYISCQPNSTYTVVFDNSNSYLTNKRIKYMVAMTAPVQDIQPDDL